MLATLLIVFREVLEAGLVIGIVLAATRGVPQRGAYVTSGIVLGLFGATVVAMFAEAIAGLMEGIGQEVFNASVLGIAVLMLVWHNVWMAREGRHIAQEMRSLGEQVKRGARSLSALAIVVAVAVLREGSEVVLFLYGIVVSSSGTGALPMVAGGLLGLGGGALVSALLYFGLLRIPTRHLFASTTALITLLACGMASQAVLFLQQAGMLNALSSTLWDSSNILPETSFAGQALHTLIGYSDQPSGMQLVAYLTTLFAMLVLMRLFGKAPASAPLTAAQHAAS